MWNILAILRFFLALVVVAEHLSWFYPGIPHGGAFVAVVAFLVVSGYSIGASLEHRPKGFYKRRLRRIYPTYVLSVALSLVPFALHGTSFAVGDRLFTMPAAWVVLAHLLFLQGFLVPTMFVNAALWTISLEVACYALAPLFARGKTIYLILIALVSLLIFLLYTGPYYGALIGGQAFVLLLWAWLAGFILWRVAPCGEGKPHPLAALLGALSYPLYLLHIPVFLILYR